MIYLKYGQLWLQKKVWKFSLMHLPLLSWNTLSWAALSWQNLWLMQNCIEQ